MEVDQVDEGDVREGAPKAAASTAANTYTIRPNFKHKYVTFACEMGVT